MKKKGGGREKGRTYETRVFEQDWYAGRQTEATVVRRSLVGEMNWWYVEVRAARVVLRHRGDTMGDKREGKGRDKKENAEMEKGKRDKKE